MNWNEVKEKIKKQTWILGALIFFGFIAGMVFLGSMESTNSPKPKVGWTNYYEKKYADSIYQQLKKVNHKVDDDELKDISESIADDVEYTYSVSELTKISNDTLLEIAYDNSTVDVNDDQQASLAYVETLILNVDLKK